MHRRDILHALSGVLLGLILDGSLAGGQGAGSHTARSLPADPESYLADICHLLHQTWPQNRTVNLVFHGHSVAAGYFKTPVVDSFNAYPHLTHVKLKERFPHAVVNVIVTAIGGEHSIQGAQRFTTQVLTHRPDVVFIDYALNDLSQDSKSVDAAWHSMIEEALKHGARVILMTPTIHRHHDPQDPATPLQLHADHIKDLAAHYRIGLVDSLTRFNLELMNGTPAQELLSNGWNHPNRRGHDLVTEEIMKWFPKIK